MLPVLLGEGAHLFPAGTRPASLVLGSAEPQGPAVRLAYRRAE